MAKTPTRRLESMRLINRAWLQRCLADPAKKAKLYKAKRRYYRLVNSTPEGKMRWLIYCANARARRIGMASGIQVADLLPLPTACPVLGIPLSYAGAGTHATDNAASLDRTVPSLGYVRGNVRIISWRANVLRKDGSPEELYAVAMDAMRLAGKLVAAA